MDTEIRAAKPRLQRGVAMFIVLGAVLLVTLFGYVGLTLAQRDQTLSGDLNDIKSRDEAAISGLQLAVNRLTAQPDSLVSILNTFITRSYARGGQSDSVWINLDTTTPLYLRGSTPSWFPIAKTSGNLTAAKVRLLAVQHADTASKVSKDSTQIYVTLRCHARGRHGDEKVVQATYRVHGISGLDTTIISYYSIPRHSFYMGGRYVSPNMRVIANGDVYVGSTNGDFVNSGAAHGIAGDLIWNDDLKINTDSLLVNGSLYVRGALYTNSGSLRVKGNMWLGNEFWSISPPATITVEGNLYVTGTGVPMGNWNSNGGLRVGGSLYYFPTNVNTPKGVTVGKNAWIVRSNSTFNINPSDSFSVGKDLIFGEPNYTHRNGYTINANKIKVGGSLFAYDSVRLTLSGGSVAETLQVFDTLIVPSGQTLTVGLTWRAGLLSANMTGYGTLSGGTRSLSSVKSPRPFPALAQFGLDTMKTLTAPSNNPVDSVKVTSLIQSNLLDLYAMLPPNKKISGACLNAIYDSLKRIDKLYNGYMCLILNQGQATDIDISSVKFNGKMILVVEGKITTNGAWPASQALDNIQVIVVRRGGDLGNFGWTGTLAGILFWENPCGKHNLSFNGKLHGALLLGTSLITPGYGYSSGDLCKVADRSEFTPNNTGSLEIVRDTAVFMDIGRNLPGALAPAKDANGNPLTTQSALNDYYYRPRLRLIHNRPFFEPIGVFR